MNTIVIGAFKFRTYTYENLLLKGTNVTIIFWYQMIVINLFIYKYFCVQKGVFKCKFALWVQKSTEGHVRSVICL